MRYGIKTNQVNLKQIYEAAQVRMSVHPDYAEKQKKIVQQCPYFNSEKRALETAVRNMREKDSNWLVWAKIERDDEYYRLKDYWLVTDKGEVNKAAEYIGMVMIYNASSILEIVETKSNIDDILKVKN